MGTRVKEFYTVLSKSGALNTLDKEDIVLTASNGRTSHASELTATEMDQVINNLRKFQNTPTPANGASKYVGDKLNGKRRRIISKFIEMGCTTPDGKADMVLIGELVLEHWKKALNDYKAAELAKIISVLETKWLPWYYKQKAGNSAFKLKGKKDGLN